VEWEYLHPAATGDGSTGTMWECPNLFPLGDRWMLLLSPIPMGRSIYFAGRWESEHFHPEQQGELDRGGCWYAPQAFLDESGRRVMFGWLQENRPREAQVAAGWSGVMSLPRVLTPGAGGGLGFAPAAETASLRRQQVRHAGLTVTAERIEPLPDISGDQLEIAVRFAPGSEGVFGLAVRRSPDGEEETAILYDAAAGILAVDRTRASTDTTAARDVRSIPLPLAPREPLALRVFVDHSVLEVFANERACLTSRIYPARSDSLGVALVARGAPVKVDALEAWELASIW